MLRVGEGEQRGCSTSIPGEPDEPLAPGGLDCDAPMLSIFFFHHAKNLPLRPGVFTELRKLQIK